MGQPKRTTIVFSEEDQKRLARLRKATGMCGAVNVREAVKLMDLVISNNTRIFIDGVEVKVFI